MAEQKEQKKIGLREVRALEPEQTIWDSSIPGFGARRQKGPGVAYVLFYRTRCSMDAGDGPRGSQSPFRQGGDRGGPGR